MFFAPGCIGVIDKSEQTTLSIAYAVAYDDIELTPGDIPLPDAKTHQFFALRGAVFARGFGYELQPIQPAEAAAITLPLWISTDDVKRAAQASGGEMSATLSAADVAADAVLERHPTLAGRFVRIHEDTDRVPITTAQAYRGVTWDLSAVEPGVYTIAAYIFSPPYNGWAIRPGLVNIVASGIDVPAAVIQPVQGVVFSYEARRLKACLAAPAGSLLRAYFRIEERPDLGWIAWLAPRPIEAPEVELCFRNPMPELSGAVRLRFDLESPEGTRATYYSPDTLTSLSGQGECIENDVICCEAPADPADAGCMAAGIGACGEEEARPQPAERADAAVARPAAHRERATGCSAGFGLLPHGHRAHAAMLALVLLALCAWRR